jgi:hypothetical protein
MHRPTGANLSKSCAVVRLEQLPPIARGISAREDVAGLHLDPFIGDGVGVESPLEGLEIVELDGNVRARRRSVLGVGAEVHFEAILPLETTRSPGDCRWREGDRRVTQHFH